MTTEPDRHCTASQNVGTTAPAAPMTGPTEPGAPGAPGASNPQGKATQAEVPAWQPASGYAQAPTTSIETRCVHGGVHAWHDPLDPISTPIYQTASFSHKHIGHNASGYDYTRESNPTRRHLEETVSALECAADTVAFASGMAAVTAVFGLFGPGDHVVCGEDLYGGVVRLVHNICEPNGIAVDFVDTADLAALEAAIRPATRAVYFETPSNPMMNVTDIRAAVELAHAHGALAIVDNTFLTPYFQNPLLLGADVVVHSGSKFLAGHNDTIAGFACVATPELAARMHLHAKTVGSTLAPHDSWLVERGIKTLAIRMERQQATAERIARWLQGQPHVERVLYVGLPEHPGHEVNAAQARGAGSMVSFAVDSAERALAVLERVGLVTFAESLGGTESLLTYPAVQTHPDVPAQVRAHLGITDRLLRLSVGLEGADDLIADLEQALA